jgi:hypothetical protein
VTINQRSWLAVHRVPRPAAKASAGHFHKRSAEEPRKAAIKLKSLRFAWQSRLPQRVPLLPVFRVPGLDSLVVPPPPLTSFLGCRSRIMASFISSLSRRQTDRTTLTCGSGVFLLKQFSPFFQVRRFYRELPVRAS